MSDLRPKGSQWTTGMFVHIDVDRNDLDVYEYRVYAHLCSRAGEETRTWVKQLTIAAITGISLRKVGEALQSLENKGWIQREARYREDGSRSTDNIIILGPPAKAKRYEPSLEELQAIKPSKHRKDQGAGDAGGAAGEESGPNAQEVRTVCAGGAGGARTSCVAEVVPVEVKPTEVHIPSLRSGPPTGPVGSTSLAAVLKARRESGMLTPPLTLSVQGPSGTGDQVAETATAHDSQLTATAQSGPRQTVLAADVEAALRAVPATDDAATYHARAGEALQSLGFTVKSEFAVPHGSPNRSGRIDLLATRGQETVAIELDYRDPRDKSVVKLNQIHGVRVVMLRDHRPRKQAAQPGIDYIIQAPRPAPRRDPCKDAIAVACFGTVEGHTTSVWKVIQSVKAELAAVGLSGEDAAQIVAWMKRDPFWRDKTISPKSIPHQVSAWRAAQARPKPGTPAAPVRDRLAERYGEEELF